MSLYCAIVTSVSASREIGHCATPGLSPGVAPRGTPAPQLIASRRAAGRGGTDRRPAISGDGTHGSRGAYAARV